MTAVPGDPFSVTWEHMLIATWAVHPALVAGKVPPGTMLDLWQGDALLSLVGLRAAPVSAADSPAAAGPAFDHLILCFYVRHQAGAETRRGLVAVKQIRPEGAHPALHRCVSAAGVQLTPTRRDLTDGCVAYEWQSGERWNRFSALRAGPAAPPAEHSVEEFITDRAWVYARQQDGSVLECRLARTPFDVAPARDMRVECEIAPAFGVEYVPIFTGLPLSTFVGTKTLVTFGEPDRVVPER